VRAIKCNQTSWYSIFATINAGKIATGSYCYTLMVDGKNSDSKKPVLVK